MHQTSVAWAPASLSSCDSTTGVLSPRNGTLQGSTIKKTFWVAPLCVSTRPARARVSFSHFNWHAAASREDAAGHGQDPRTASSAAGVLRPLFSADTTISVVWSALWFSQHALEIRSCGLCATREMALSSAVVTGIVSSAPSRLRLNALGDSLLLAHP